MYLKYLNLLLYVKNKNVFINEKISKNILLYFSILLGEYLLNNFNLYLYKS